MKVTVTDPHNDPEDTDGLVVGEPRESAADFVAGFEGRTPPGDGQHDPEPEEDHSKPPSQATILTALGAEADLWHDPDGTAWATVEVRGHREHYRIRSKGFRTWLRRRFYEEEARSASSQAVQDAVENLCGQAEFDGEEHRVHLRVAEHRGALYLDLGDESWSAVEITSDGWQVIPDPPIKFLRRDGMLPLPHPARGGDLEDLRRFLNVADEDWPLVAGWAVATLRPSGPYPVLNLIGIQGSGKSTFARVLRRLIDPNKADVRRAPKDERDLILAATNGQIVSLENLSWLPAWLSDALAALATGSGFATRTLYENDEETIFSACRPIILNGIEEVAVRPDLLDRSILVNLPEIGDAARLPEIEFWDEFDQARPKLLGALLDVVTVGLSRQHVIRPSELPRMADFAMWVMACAPGLNITMEEFVRRYSGNRASAHDLALEASPIGTPVRELALAHGTWEGTAGELHQALTTEERRRSKTWPSSGQAMAGALKRVIPALRAAGIDVEYLDTVRPRRWRLGRETTDTSDMSDIDPAERAAQGTLDVTPVTSSPTASDGNGTSQGAESADHVTYVRSVTPPATQSNDGSEGGDPDHRCQGCGAPIDRPYWCDTCAREPVTQGGAA